MAVPRRKQRWSVFCLIACVAVTAASIMKYFFFNGRAACLVDEETRLNLAPHETQRHQPFISGSEGGTAENVTEDKAALGSDRKRRQFPWPDIPIPDTCRYVYVDCGCNLGVNVRKVFEPHLYPGAPLAVAFNKIFGHPNQRVLPEWGLCVFAFEPNPVHTQRLQEIEVAYRRKGWQVFIHARTAVGVNDSLTKIYRDKDERQGDVFFDPKLPHPLSHSSSTVRDHGLGGTAVRQVDLVDFLLRLSARHIPTPPSISDHEDVAPPAVILKIDIEGSEHNIMPKLLLSGALCTLNSLYIEWHKPRQGDKVPTVANLDQVLPQLLQAHRRCPVRYFPHDDETYGSDVNVSVVDSLKAKTLNALP
ncbi:hypothetical protein CYMTET_16232 [Cymbomonas tetramitiformis]|uniref:Methyltransferase FkbM domain-containing protein n=1 Tax=Cymbomonas tetramitiformis TaxID=36881 RepID=A0AAE0GCL9_9CHLO|nr:hypothetical protein CYMTET_16232 [Cymbomonas tetramitiformis]